jgi:ankyrin repeat protein
MSQIKRLFEKNPDGFAKDENDPSHFYNTLSNGKTLLYSACREGRTEIVEFFLNKRLNAFIKCKINEHEYESCLQAACRWNYTKIVKLLLDKVDYSLNEIKEVLNIDGLSKSCQSIIKRLINSKFKKTTVCCF